MKSTHKSMLFPQSSACRMEDSGASTMTARHRIHRTEAPSASQHPDPYLPLRANARKSVLQMRISHFWLWGAYRDCG
jgi:hypothetical protein